MTPFKAVQNDDGSNWLIAWCGCDENGNNWSVNTNQIHASELHQFTRGADGDAELIAELLNKYYAEHPQP